MNSGAVDCSLSPCAMGEDVAGRSVVVILICHGLNSKLPHIYGGGSVQTDLFLLCRVHRSASPLGDPSFDTYLTHISTVAGIQPSLRRFFVRGVEIHDGTGGR